MMKDNNASNEKQSLGSKVKAKLDKAQRIFLISNVLLTLIFAANSIIGMIKGFGEGAIQYVTIALLVAYIIAFVVLVVLFNKDKKCLKENMTNYKFAIKVMKQVVNIMNLALALSVMVEAFTIQEGGSKIFALFASILGIVFAVFKFIRFIFKFVRKKKKAKIKAAKKEAKAQAMQERKAKFNTLLGRGGSEEVAISDEEEEKN